MTVCFGIYHVVLVALNDKSSFFLSLAQKRGMEGLYILASGNVDCVLFDYSTRLWATFFFFWASCFKGLIGMTREFVFAL